MRRIDPRRLIFLDARLCHPHRPLADARYGVRRHESRRFIAWVRRHLVRHLRRGDIVVLDNLAAHKAPAVRDLIEETGATIRFLPPYWHDFNPIEAAW
jgi:hypothetical protein